MAKVWCVCGCMHGKPQQAAECETACGGTLCLWAGSGANLRLGGRSTLGYYTLDSYAAGAVCDASKFVTAAAAAAASGAACNATHMSSCGFLWQPAPALGTALQLGASFMAHR